MSRDVHVRNCEGLLGKFRWPTLLEDAFGELKGNLQVGPIFHWTNQRIIGHLTVCFLAYLCQAYLTKKLRQKKIKLQSKAIDENIIRSRALTAPTAIKELASLMVIHTPKPDKNITKQKGVDINAELLLNQ